MSPTNAQQNLATGTVKRLTLGSRKSCWLVVPPGFGGHQIAEIIRQGIETREPRALVAQVPAEEISSDLTFVRHVHRSWSSSHEIAPLPALDDGTEVSFLVSSLLSTVPTGLHPVQVITDFEKLLTGEVSEELLSSLRTAEQSGRLQSVVICAYDRTSLVRRWKAENRVLAASSYGDSHLEHLAEVETLESVTGGLKPPAHSSKHLARFFEMSGGVPDAFSDILDEWLAEGQQDLQFGEERRLMQTAKRSVRRLVEKLDPREGDTRYRDFVVQVYQQQNLDSAIHHLSQHPWSAYLLGRAGLRGECIGEACVDDQIAEYCATGSHPGEDRTQWPRLRELYRRREFTRAGEILPRCPPPLVARDVVLGCHIKIMAELFTRGSGQPGLDTDWKAVQKLLKLAMKAIRRLSLQDGVATALDATYEQLTGFAEALIKASSGKSSRIVDVLALSKDQGHGDSRRHAFAVMVLQHRAASSLPGHRAAVNAAVSLPEQAIRVLGLWTTEVDYYSVPDGADSVGDAIRAAQEAYITKLFRTPLVPGTQFPGIRTYAHFCLETLKRVSADELSCWPAGSHDELSDLLTVFEPRNDVAHAEVVVDESTRMEYFEVTQALLSCIECCDGAMSSAEALRLIAPLPLLRSDGSLEYFRYS